MHCVNWASRANKCRRWIVPIPNDFVSILDKRRTTAITWCLVDDNWFVFPAVHTRSRGWRDLRGYTAHRPGHSRPSGARNERLARPGLSWKVRYRTLSWFLSQMTKLYRARSLLYRRQVLQENIRWKALLEIYKICMLLHRSDLNISQNFRQKFSHFLVKFAKFRYFWILFTDFCSDFDEILSEFRR